MRFSTPSGVLFDFGGTLDADGIRWAERFHQAYRAEGGTLGFDSFEPLFRASDSELAADPGTCRLGFQAMVSAQARLVIGACPDAAGIQVARVAERFHAAAVAVASRNRPVLERLGRHWRLGVVSNFTGNLDRCLAELGLLELLTAVADSAVVGMKKPSPRIFTDLLAEMGVVAEESWMVGDNFDADIRPAAALGLRTCWLTTPDRLSPPGAFPTARITRLPNLEAILEPACMD
jgi:putative hydrolase of the HAD superfamily